MAEYNGNDIYLTINGTDVTARWRQFEMSLKVGDEDVSAGAGVDWEKHAQKLFQVTAKATLVYDDIDADGDLSDLWDTDSVIAVVYGPEGNTAGKPCHSANFLVTGISGPTTTHDKKLVMFEYDMIQTGVPTKNIYAGDTF